MYQNFATAEKNSYAEILMWNSCTSSIKTQYGKLVNQCACNLIYPTKSLTETVVVAFVRVVLAMVKSVTLQFSGDTSPCVAVKHSSAVAVCKLYQQWKTLL